MANKDFPSGLAPINEGGSGRPRLTEYTVAAAATPIYKGAPMKLVSTGTAAMATDETGQTYWLGASAGYYPTSTVDIKVLIWDDPNQLFTIQDDGSAALAETNIGNNANFITADSGDSFTGQSIAELDATTPATTATFPLQIVGLVKRIDNSWGANADLIVRWRFGAHHETSALGI